MPTRNSYMRTGKQYSDEAMRKYSFHPRFSLLIYLSFLLPNCLQELYIFSLLYSVKVDIKCKDRSPSNMITRKVPLSIVQISNMVYTKVILLIELFLLFSTIFSKSL